MTTLKEIREIACNIEIQVLLQKINEIDKKMLYCTPYEAESAKAEIMARAKRIQEILKNHK